VALARLVGHHFAGDCWLAGGYRDAIFTEGFTMKDAIGYLRVSTSEQGRSGLGLNIAS
jgi:hypothetical protein